MTGEGKARRARVMRTLELADFQPASSDNQAPTTNHIQHPTTQVLEFGLQLALGIALPLDRNGTAGQGSQSADSEQHS